LIIERAAIQHGIYEALGRRLLRVVAASYGVKYVGMLCRQHLVDKIRESEEAAPTPHEIFEIVEPIPLGEFDCEEPEYPEPMLQGLPLAEAEALQLELGS